METGRWNGHKFEVSPTLIRSFTALTLKAASETKDSTSDNQKYVKRKNSKPVEVSMTVMLNAFAGCDVREEASALAKDALNGKSDYMYIGASKIATCKLMLTEASVTEINIAPGGQWVSCQVALVFKQSSKFDGGTSSRSSSGSSSSKNSKSGSVNNTYYTTRLSTLATGSAASNAQKKIQELTARAGKTASKSKVSSASSKLYFLNSSHRSANMTH